MIRPVQVVIRLASRVAIFACIAYFAVASSVIARAADLNPADGFIDVHFHSHPHIRRGGTLSYDLRAAALNALATMRDHGISFALLMPPPQPPNHRNPFSYEELKRVVARDSSRLGFLGGGGTLNPIIHDTDPGNVTPQLRARFIEIARAILDSGARGFGEMTALHLSFRPAHPFEAASPDHPLFLVLADIAGERGVPIDLHMESVVRERPTPRRALRRGEGNPKRLNPNIAAFARLLSHNRKAAVIWSHAAWDNTRQRPPRLMRRLLSRHTNLYMSIKIRDAQSNHRDGKGKGKGKGRRRGGGNIFGPDGEINREWLQLFRDFPNRFLIGSDTHVYVDTTRSRISAQSVARLLKKLPPDIANAVGFENAVNLFRLK